MSAEAKPTGDSSKGMGTGETVPNTLREFLLYFLRLGTFGFGGPIALAGHMERDLVGQRRWISRKDYLEGLAFAQLAPGPLAAQLAIYLGWIRGGIVGATLVGLAFILPSFLMVMALSALYLRFGGLSWIQGAFYGIGAAVIAIIGFSAYKLIRKTMGRDRLLWAILASSALATAWTEREIIWIFLACGAISLLLRAPPRLGPKTLGAAPWMVWLASGLHGPAPAKTLANLIGYFVSASLFVFGSGLAIVPFLHGGVVQQFHWLSERQFIDAVAVAMITPGPVVITVAFIGYLAAGPIGGVLAAVGVFLPNYLFVVLLGPQYHRFVDNPQVKAFVEGVTAAAVGAIAGAVWVLGRRAIVDVPTGLIATGSLIILFRAKKIPEPLLIGMAGALGYLAFSRMH